MINKIKLTIIAASIALVSMFGADTAQAQSMRHSRHTTVRHHRGPVRHRVIVRHRPVRRTRVIVRHRPGHHRTRVTTRTVIHR